MLGKLNMMQTAFAIIPSKTDKTMVRIIEEVIFSVRMSERLSDAIDKAINGASEDKTNELLRGY